MKKIAYYPGSFDPMTNGHVDVLRQASNIFDEVVVAIGIHPGKKPMFDFVERSDLIHQVVDELGLGRNATITVEAFDNLVVDAARNAGAATLVRGLRDGSDLDYEMQMAGMNGAMAEDIGTIFFPANPSVRSITATLVRQISKMGGDVSSFVPSAVLNALKQKNG